MPSFEHRVPASLTGLVAGIEGYDFRLPDDAVHHGLPSRRVTVIVAFDEPLDCGWADGRDRSGYWALAGGLHTRPAHIHTHGHQHGIQLSLTPLGARRLLGVPASALGGTIAGHEGLPGGVPGWLRDRLQEASWPERFRLLDAHLAGLAAREPGGLIHDDLRRAWTAIVRSGGGIAIARLASELGRSRRWLSGRFAAEFGVSPKELARVVRFERSRALLGAGRPPAEVAQASGYADQPHLNREWRALAGFTPTQLAANFPIVQDDPAGAARG